jgi:hypothetical protein
VGQFITPPTIPLDTYCRTLKIPNTPFWIGTVTGALMPLIYSSEWVSTGGITPDEAAQRAEQMFNEYLSSGDDGECGEMTCCDDILVIYRINPDTGGVEQSSNGGSSWTPAANGLASVLVNPIPPVTSGVAATKCDAATNVLTQVMQWITQVSNDFDTSANLTEFAAGVFAAILAALLLFITGGAIGPIEALIIPTIGAALAAAWGAGRAAFDAYWITENFNIVLCAAYCNIGDDGAFTDAQFTAFWNKCNTDLQASPAKMLFMGFMSSSGATGLNVMAATGFSADADCSDCSCSDSKRIYVTDTGGTEVSWDGHTLVASSTTGGEFGHILYLQFDPNTASGGNPNVSICGKMTLVSVDSGAMDGGGSCVIRPCGVGSGIPADPSVWPTSSTNLNVLQSHSAFTVSLTATN